MPKMRNRRRKRGNLLVGFIVWVVMFTVMGVLGLGAGIGVGAYFFAIAGTRERRISTLHDFILAWNESGRSAELAPNINYTYHYQQQVNSVWKNITNDFLAPSSDVSTMSPQHFANLLLDPTVDQDWYFSYLASNPISFTPSSWDQEMEIRLIVNTPQGEFPSAALDVPVFEREYTDKHSSHYRLRRICFVINATGGGDLEALVAGWTPTPCFGPRPDPPAFYEEEHSRYPHSIPVVYRLEVRQVGDPEIEFVRLTRRRGVFGMDWNGCVIGGSVSLVVGFAELILFVLIASIGICWGVYEFKKAKSKADLMKAAMMMRSGGQQQQQQQQQRPLEVMHHRQEDVMMPMQTIEAEEDVGMVGAKGDDGGGGVVVDLMAKGDGDDGADPFMDSSSSDD